MHRWDTLLVVFVCVLLVATPVSGVAGAQITAEETTDGRPVVTLENDDRPGRIVATARFLPSAETGPLTVDVTTIPWNTTVTDSSGFERVGDGTYRWDGTTPEPTLTYEIRLSQPTVVAADVGDPMAVDPGEWAMIETQRAVPAVEGASGPPAVAVADEGYVTDFWTFIGPVDYHSRTVNGEEIRLVVPEASAPVSTPDTILDQLARTNDELPIGGRADRVAILSLPSNGITTPWTGVASADSAVVRDDTPATTQSSVWIHEYVHTRQQLVPTEATEWLLEASANYYSSHETLHQNRLAYAGFEAAITSSEFQQAVLADPSTWRSVRVPYLKGQRVLAYLDAQIRRSTDGRRTLADVLRQFDDDRRLTLFRFYETVAAVSTESVATDVQRYIESPELAPPPENAYAYVEQADGDADGDSLSNRAERENGTHPFVADTDGDGLSDVEEFVEYGTDPLSRDTDGDGRSDGAELSYPQTNPTAADTDDDGLRDDEELSRATDPTSADTDGDGLEDGTEVDIGTSPRYADTDGDGLDDGTERSLGTDPLASDTDGDGLGDSTERRGETDPTTADTDGDSYGDRAEQLLGTDPTSKTSLVTYGKAYAQRLLGGIF